MPVTIDGNEAAASVAYRLCELCSIYPITPSSPMAELADEWSSQGRPNVWGTVPAVVETNASWEGEHRARIQQLLKQADARMVAALLAIGTVMFHEKQKVRDIAPGALVMLVGVVLLSLAG